LAPGASTTVQVTIEPSTAAVAGVYRLDLIIEQDGVERRVPVRFEVPGTGFVAPRERTYVGTFRVAADGEITVFGLTEYASIPDAYRVLTMGGDVRVLAWVDANSTVGPTPGTSSVSSRLPSRSEVGSFATASTSRRSRSWARRP
jgi:hypothetical protein